MKNLIEAICRKIKSLHRKIRSWYGKMNGFSSCSHCGLAWNVVDGMSIPYTARIPEFSYKSMFPICWECFKKLDSDKIFSYCQELVNQWKTYEYSGSCDIVDMEIVKYNIKWLR